MATLPTIASTANRRILPSADLRVDGATPAAFGAAIGAGLQQVGQAGQEAGAAIQSFEIAKQQEQDRLANFDRQTTFVNFGADQATKLEEARRNASGAAQDFTKSYMEGFDADAGKFLEAIPERDRHAWQANMAKLRAGVAQDALRAEFSQRDAYYKTTLGDTLSKLANGASQTPAQLDAWRTQGEQIINASGLSAQDKLEYTTRWKGNVALAAASGDVERDPEGAMARLGGIDFVVQAAGGGYTAGTSSYTPGGKATLKGDIISFFKGKGLSDHVAKGIAAGIESEASGNHAAVNKDSGAYGLGQWLGARKEALFARYGQNPTREQQLEFLYSELKGGDAGGPGVLAAKNEGQAVDRYIRNFMRPGKDTESGIARGMKALGYKVQTSAPAGDNGTVTTQEVGTGDVDPRYADLPFDVRMQLVGAAKREIDRRENAVQRAEQEQHATWLNGFMTELHDGKAGAEDIEAARRSGRLTDIDEIARAENIVEQRNKAGADLNFFNAAMAAPGFTWNPYDDRQKKGVEAAVKQMGGSPQAAFNVWLKTGILADSGAVALRGAMISTKPDQVSAGAAIASNMLARNPNAFAGVQGGEDIEKSALLYGHYVNDLGYTPQDAAQRVAQQNSPEMRAKIKMGQPELAAFRKDVQKTSVEGTLGRALDTTWFDGKPTFVGPEQRQAASQDYADLAADHYSQYGDATAAKAFALSQMKKLYGVVNGQLMKYPPTRAYPAIGGEQGYIFSQAAADIKRVTGRTIAPDKVYLLPLPTATAEAFRAGKPAPYSVHYVDEVNGQQVYRVLNGKAFYADPQAEARRVGTERQAQLKKEREDYLAREQFQRDATVARFGYLPGVTDQYAPSRKK